MTGIVRTIGTQIHDGAHRDARGWFVLLALVGLLASCGGGNGGYRASEFDVRPAQGGKFYGGTLRWNSLEDVRSLDPIRVGDTASHDAAMQLYDGLVQLGDDLQAIPSIAESWQMSEDGRVYTFHLRKGVLFHDNDCFPGGKGRECVASDVVYSLQRVVDPKSESTGTWVFRDLIEGVDAYREANAERVSGLEAVDDYTVRITLTQPFVPFMQRLAMSYGYIVPREAVERYGLDFFQHPVGTGPFVFERWSKDLELVAKRNPNYWMRDEHGNALPYLDRVVNTFIKVQTAEFQEFELGNLDTHNPVADTLFEDIIDLDGELQPAYAGRFKVSSAEMLTVYYFGFTLDREPFKGNVKLRQAFNHAIDRQQIIRTVLKGRAVRAEGVVPPSIPGWKSTGVKYTYDPERARTLLAEAGYPNGEGLETVTCLLNSGGKRNERIAEVIQQQLNDIGVKIKLQLLEWPQFLESVENGRAVFWRLGWVADYEDPENFLALFDSRKFAPTGPNNSHYSNPEFDALFQASDTEVDPVKRFDLLRRAEEIVMADAPWLFLHHVKEFRLCQNYVNGLKHNRMNYLQFKYVCFEPREDQVSE